jgi:hypothetical protein
MFGPQGGIYDLILDNIFTIQNESSSGTDLEPRHEV